RISADIGGGSINIKGQSVINQGIVQAINGDSLAIDNIADAAGLSISSGGTLTLGGIWRNSAALTVSNSTCVLNGTWTNAGVLTVNNSAISFNGGWNNAGTLNFTNSILNLGGRFGPPSLGKLNRSGGTVNLTGTLDLGGGILALDATTGSWVLNGGTLRNA